MKRWPILLATALLLIFIFAACTGGNGTSSDDIDDIRVYVVTVEVVGEDGLPVSGVSVAGDNIFGSTEEGGTLERAMVDEGQFRQHLDATYQVEKSGCIVDRQQVVIDEKFDNLATITLHLACIEPLVRFDRPVGTLLFDGENLWMISSQNTVTKVARDGNVLGIFPVGHGPTRLAFDGENVWVAYSSYAIPDVGPLEKLPDRDRLTKLDMDGRQVGNYRIGLTDSPDSAAGLQFDLDEITDLAFDGENIWVSHRFGGVTKLALDGTELWTTPEPQTALDQQQARLLFAVTTGPAQRLIFDGERLVILGKLQSSSRFLGIFDLQGTPLEHYEIDIDYKVDDAAFGGDGIWLSETRGITKIGMHGQVLLGPFQTPTAGGTQLIFDGQHIWITEPVDGGPDIVRRLSQDGQILDTFTVGISIGGLVSDGEGIWVTTGDDYEWSGTPGASDRIPTTGALWRITPD